LSAWILPWFPRLLLLAFLTPVLVGLAGTWLPAFGWFPALGQNTFSVEPWFELLNYPGSLTALQLSLVTGIGSSLLALGATLLILVAFYPSAGFRRIEKLLAPILSVPHAAFAIGIGFLIAPSGWLVRWISTFSGWPEFPPNWMTFKDPFGISLLLVLALKEIPFLLFMALASLPGLKVEKTLWLGASLGYRPGKIWLTLIWPLLYERLRLPFYAVVAFSLSVVDIALIAGPTAPPTLAVMATRLFNDPDLLLRLPGAAAATTLLITTVFALAIFYWLERPMRAVCLSLLGNGKRPRFNGGIKLWASLVLIPGILCYLTSLLVLVLWSVAGQWRFPDLWPGRFSADTWSSVPERLFDPLLLTLSTGISAAAIALVLVIGALENEVRLRRYKPAFSAQRLLWVLYLPLLVPQIAFLFGFQVSLAWLRLNGQWWILVWSHLVFVLPYTFLTLSGPYRAYDERYSWVGLSLSGSRLRTFVRIKLGQLWRPIGYTLATGFAVSVAQYLPTLFVGGGRFATVTTEAVSIASGSDRRSMAVYALVQQTLPLAGFALALSLAAWRYRHHRTLQQGQS
jgi:putative thiamine transport system permease protein